MQRGYEPARCVLTLILCAVICTGAIPASAVEPSWEISKSKTANREDLTETNDVTVTLQLPAAEDVAEDRTIDVVMILDASGSTITNGIESSLNVRTTAVNFINQLYPENNLNIKLGVVSFARNVSVSFTDTIGGNAVPKLLTDANKSSAIPSASTLAMQALLNSGSNIHGAVMKAKEILTNDTAVDAKDKYIVLLTDGGSTYYTINDPLDVNYGKTGRRYYYNNSAATSVRAASTDESYYPASNPSFARYTVADFYDLSGFVNLADFTSQTNAAAKTGFYDESLVTYSAANVRALIEDGTVADGKKADYKSLSTAGAKYSDYPDTPTVSSGAFDYCKSAAPAGWPNLGPEITPGVKSAYYSQLEKGFVLVGNELLGAVEDDGYHVITISWPYKKDNMDTRALYIEAKAFMDWIGEDIGPQYEYKSVSSNDIVAGMNAYITNLLNSGSVKDVIGSDFDVVPKTFTMTVGGTDLPANPSPMETATHYQYTFGVPDSGVYPYTVDYYPSGDGSETREHFIWTVNVPVKVNRAVTLSYDLVLVNRSTTLGLHADIPTNQETTLHYTDSTGKPGIPEDFDSPLVYYLVKKDSGNDDPFIDEHYGYIIGYPDGTVHPVGDITRAEVVTVFFRLLKDSVREKYWTQKNSFSDVKTGNWHNNAISVIANIGIINGYPDGTFRPDAGITRAELAIIASRFSEMLEAIGDTAANFSDIEGYWAQFAIEAAVSVGWLQGYPDGTFRPEQNLTRAEFMTLVNRILERQPEKEYDLLAEDMIIWPDNMNKEAWFYLMVQEATNSHDYLSKNVSVPRLLYNYERWVEIREVRDWAQFEKEWSTAYSAPVV